MRPEINYKRVLLDLAQELKITASEIERGLNENQSPDDLLNDLMRRHLIHSGLSLRATRKLRDAVKRGK